MNNKIISQFDKIYWIKSVKGKMLINRNWKVDGKERFFVPNGDFKEVSKNRGVFLMFGEYYCDGKKALSEVEFQLSNINDWVVVQGRKN